MPDIKGARCMLDFMSMMMGKIEKKLNLTEKMWQLKLLLQQVLVRQMLLLNIELLKHECILLMRLSHEGSP